MIRADIQDDIIPIRKNLLKLNGQLINITKRDDLRLYTYLAKLTKRLGNLETTSPEQKKCTKMMNRTIHNEAVYYIDNIL